MSILNIGAQALQANLVALQTTGNNIANVNTCLLYTSPSPRD
mgnify:CR=1 FL=1